MTRIASLDSLRIIAEFVVIYYHFIVYSADWQLSYAFSLFATDGIGIFFILSGCVSMIKYKDENGFQDWKSCIDFWKRKYVYTYPLLMILFILQTIGLLVNNKHHCPWKIACYVMDFFLISPWFLCYSMELDVVGAAWYLVILYYLWFSFPLIQPMFQRFYVNGNVWYKFILIYVVSMCMTLPSLYTQIQFRYLPISRLPQFVLGMGIPYTLKCKLSIQWPIIAVIVITIFYLCVYYYFQFDLHMCKPFLKLQDNCHTFQDIEVTTLPCMPVLFEIWPKMDLMWVIVIHYLACTDILNYSIFKILNEYSLVLYLFHQVIGWLTQLLLKTLHMDELLNVTFLIIWTYFICYYIHILYQKAFSYLTTPTKIPDTIALVQEI